MTAADPGALIQRESERLSALRLQMLEAHPFWGFLLLPMELVPALGMGVPMSCDLVSRIWYDPECTRHLRIRQLGYVLLHQVCHVAYATLVRQGVRNAWCWHRASDFAINRVLEQLCSTGPGQLPLYEIPTTVVDGQPCFAPLRDPRFGGRPAEAIYEILLNEMMEEGGGGGGDGTGEAQEEGEAQEGSGKGVGPRMVELQLPAGRRKQEEGNEGEAEGEAEGEGEAGDKATPGSASKSGSGAVCQRVLDHGGGIDYHLAPPTDEHVQERMMERLMDAYDRWEASGKRGEVPLALARAVKAARGFEVNWRRLFFRLAEPCLGRDELSLSRPHKRYLAADLLVAGPVSDQLPLLVVSVDTSGSISSDFLDHVATELERLAVLTEECLLIVCDAKVHDVVPTQKLSTFLKERKFSGGGGTSHLPVFEYLKNNHLTPTLFVGITDLFSEFPKKRPPFPVLWLVTESHGDAPFGHVVVAKPEVFPG